MSGMRGVIVLTMTMMILSATAAEPDQAEKGAKIKALLQGWQERLQLTDEQKAKTKPLLEKLTSALAPLGEKIQSGELSKRDALQQIQSARKSFESSFSAILTDEQKKEWGRIQEDTRAHIAKVIGEKRAAKLQQQYKLSDSQVQSTASVLTTQTAALMDTMRDAQESEANRRRQEKREKRQMAMELKGIADEADDELKKIFTAEQWQQYEADKAKRKEEMKAKRGRK